jgi:hypothetical protein
MDFSLRCAFVHGTAAVRMKIGADRPDHATVEIESGHAYRDIVTGRRGGVSANGQPADLSVGDCDGGRRECLGLGVTAVAGVEQAERYAGVDQPTIAGRKGRESCHRVGYLRSAFQAPHT